MRYTLPLFLSAVLGANAHAQSAVSVYVSPPDNQNVVARDFSSSNSYSFLTETFSLSAGSFNGFGTDTPENPDDDLAANNGLYSVLTGSPSINSVAAYGGGDGQGNYLSIGDGASVSIVFDTPVNYFGFQWTAGNSGNLVTLFDTENNNLGTFNTSTLTTLLPQTPGATVEGMNGDIYETSSFYGLPGSRGTTSGEPFAYVHFVNDGPLAISRIILSHTGGGAFESDNHSIRFENVVVDPETSPLVAVGAVPEPSAALLGVAGAAVFLRRRRR